MKVPEGVEKLVRILSEREFEWEVYWETGRNGSFSIEREELERSQRRFFSGIGLRVGIDGKTGFSYLTGFTHDKATLEMLVDKAEKLAKVGSVPFRGFPSWKGVLKKVDGLYDKRIEEIPFERARSLAVEYLEIMKGLKAARGELSKEYVLSGSLGLGFKHRGVVNSNGIEFFERKTLLFLQTYAVRKGPVAGNGYVSQGYTSLDGFKDAENIVARAIEEADETTSAKKLDGYSGEVLLEVEAFASLLSIFLENLSGDSVYYSRSRFSQEDLGKEFFSEILSIYDDSTVPGSVGGYSFDGEGTPGGRTALVEGGKLSGFLLDHTYGSFLGLESTGNALRDFRRVPYIGTSNILVEPGKENLERDGWEGVVISKVFGEHTANPVSGDFSLTVELGYTFRNGELVPIRGNMVSGNVFDVLRSISRVGKRVERRGSFYSPSVVARMRVV